MRGLLVAGALLAVLIMGKRLPASSQAGHPPLWGKAPLGGTRAGEQHLSHWLPHGANSIRVGWQHPQGCSASSGCPGCWPPPSGAHGKCHPLCHSHAQLGILQGQQAPVLPASTAPLLPCA